MSASLERIVADLVPLKYRELHLIGDDLDWVERIHRDGLGDRVGLRRIRRGATAIAREAASDVFVIANAAQISEPNPIHATLMLDLRCTEPVGNQFTVIERGSQRFGLSYEPPLVFEKLARHRLTVIRSGTPAWRPPPLIHGQSLRRWTSHKPSLSHLLTLNPDHPAITDRRTLFRQRITTVKDAPRLLICGSNSRKIGGMVTKGKWAGMPILTLTLEERRTCWTGCRHYRDCYGNKMNWSRRIQHGPALEARLEIELRRLNREHPGGFVVRLHALGDFYSAKYVRAWVRWLGMFPALHAFGYTSWPVGSGIGKAVGEAVAANWDRFAIRFSNQNVTERGATTIYREPESPRVTEGIVCPAQTDRTECCATCTLCWQTQTNIVFVAH